MSASLEYQAASKSTYLKHNKPKVSKTTDNHPTPDNWPKNDILSCRTLSNFLVAKGKILQQQGHIGRPMGIKPLGVQPTAPRQLNRAKLGEGS